MAWWNKPGWDALFRGALFKQDYDTALSIATDRIRSGHLRDAEEILGANACYSYQEVPASTEYYRAIEAAIRQTFPDNEQLKLMALNDLACALGATAEGIAIAEQAIEGWGRIGTPRDAEDSWPKQEEAANMARGRLSNLYTRAGRMEEAARVLPLELCRHLNPVRQYLTRKEVKGTYCLNEKMQVVYFVGVVLDVEAIARSLPLSTEVRTLDYFDRKAAYSDLGFRCEIHLMWILGTHYEEFDAGDPRREPSNWFR